MKNYDLFLYINSFKDTIKNTLIAINYIIYIQCKKK